MVNEKLIEEFKKLEKQIKYEINHGTKEQNIGNMYRLRAISKVISVLGKLKFEIKSVDQVKNIKNIGKKTLERISEILKTDKLAEINPDIANEKYFAYIEELTQVFGIGEKTAFKLYKKYGVTSIADLRKLHKEKKIELPDNVVKGLKYVDKIKRNIPRSEMDTINNLLVKVCMEVDPQLFGVICGSYRRLKISSGDIDLLILHPNIKTVEDMDKINYIGLVVDKLIKKGYIVDSFTSRDVVSKYFGIFQLSDKHDMRRFDIRYLPYESYYYALLYFTGSGEFNRMMRQVAIDSGYLLNEYGLYDEKGKFIPAKSEKEIFDALGMEYISPEFRD